MNLCLFHIIIFLKCLNAQSSILIGVTKIAFINEFSKLKSLNSVLNSTIYSIEHVKLSPFDSKENFDKNIKSLSKFQVIIASYDSNLVRCTASLKIPYFMLSKSPLKIHTANLNDSFTLDASYDYLQLSARIIQSIFQQKLDNLNIICENSADGLLFLQSLQELTLNICFVSSASTQTEMFECFDKKFPINSPYKFVIYLEDETILDKILKAMLLKSLIYSKQIYIIKKYNINDALSKFESTGGYLKSFEQPDLKKLYNSLTNQNIDVQKKLFEFSIQHLAVLAESLLTNGTIKTFLAEESLWQRILKAKSSFLQFNWAGKKFDFLMIEIERIYSFSSNVQLKKFFIRPNMIKNQSIITKIYNIGIENVYRVGIIRSSIFSQVDGFTTHFQAYLNKIRIGLQIETIPNGLVGNIGIYSGNATESNSLYDEILQKKIDFALTPVIITPEYSRFVDYSMPMVTNSWSMLLKRSEKEFQILFLAAPFSPMVWIMLVASGVLFTIFIWLLEKLSPSAETKLERLNFYTIPFIVMSSLFMQRNLITSKLLSIHFFYFAMWMGFFLLFIYYIATMTTILYTNSQFKEIPFNNLQESINYSSRQNIKWIFINESLAMNSIRVELASINFTTISDFTSPINSPISVLAKLFILAKKQNPDILLQNSVEDAIKLLEEDDQTILVDDKLNNNWRQKKHCSLIAITDAVTSFSMGLAMNKGFKSRKKINNLIVELTSNSELNSMERKLITGNCPNLEALNAQIDKPIKLTDMIGVFIAYGAAMGYSILVIVIEFIAHKMDLQQQRISKGKSLKFGKIYSATISSTNLHGIFVKMRYAYGRKESPIFFIPKKFLMGKQSTDANAQNSMNMAELGFIAGTKITIKYIGNDPITAKRRFIRVV